MSSTCELIHFPTPGLPYPWVRRGIRRTVEMRLYRCLGNAIWMDAWPSTTCCTLPQSTSDYCHLLLSFDRLQLVSRPPFRFQQIWLKAPGFLQMVEQWWMSFSFHGCPMFVLSSKLRALKAKLKEWNWRDFGDINAKMNDSVRALESIQTEIINSGPSDERLLREDQKLFTADAEVVNTGLVEGVIPSLVTVGDNMLLTSIPSQEEIFGVVKSMDSLSSPGPDGFGGIFFLALLECGWS
ncbi:hypothetical protein GBA52_013414 [Prunus armeniaca]|nr:hypothetical protein GBA52_013414 [Prunus armeniaca]